MQREKCHGFVEVLFNRLERVVKNMCSDIISQVSLQSLEVVTVLERYRKRERKKKKK